MSQDVLCAMDIVEAKDDEFGHEGAGIVRRIGPEVQDLKVGDRVMVVGSCLFGTQLVLSENLCERIPGGLSFTDAASMPCVFSTSIYSIFDVGNLKKGQVRSPQPSNFLYQLLTYFIVHSYPQCLWWSWNCDHPACSNGRCRDLRNCR